MQRELLIIDPQIDFCDPKGALFVTGADRDVTRLAAMVRRLAPKLDNIHVTLDSHHFVDIAHPIFWKDGSGSAPTPFIIITAARRRNRPLDRRAARECTAGCCPKSKPGRAGFPRP